MSAHPHHVGSPGKKPYRIISITNLKAGFEVAVETFYVLFPTPKTRILEMTEPAKI